MKIWEDNVLTCISPPQPRLLRPLVCLCYCWVRDVSAQPMGPNPEND